MNKIKKIVKKLLGNQLSRKLGNFKSNFTNLIILITNTLIDGKLFYKHSMVFKQDTFNKIESRIVLHYHSLEKGFLHEILKFRFGKYRVIELVKLLKYKDVVENHKKTQIAAAYLAMCKYYEKHQQNDIDISDYFKKDDYGFFKKLSMLNSEIVKSHMRIEFFNKSESNFLNFSKSRRSVRSFTGEKISFETINKAIEIAKTAPSVCNRQPTRVYYVENKEKIDKILSIQGGLTGYTDNIKQLLVLVSDRNYFYSIGERNQLYVDGGIFLMNLLYALHYYHIGACPAHWGHNSNRDKKIKKEINLSDSEKVICLIPIGIPRESFLTTLSLRRDNDEILKIVT